MWSLRSSARISPSVSDVSNLFSNDDSARGDSRSAKVQLVARVLPLVTANGGEKDIVWLPIRSAIFLFV